MKYIKTFLLLLAIPYLLVCMKIAHYKMERAHKRKTLQKGYKNHALLEAMNTDWNQDTN